jgi:hypothetical protein
MVRRKLVRMGRICRRVLLPMLFVSAEHDARQLFKEMRDLTNK